MTRTTKQDATDRMDQATGKSTAAEEAFGRQANKGILADKVAEELNVPRRTAARVLDAVLDAVSDLLRGRGKVAVKGFGTFERIPIEQIDLMSVDLKKTASRPGAN